MRKLFIALSMAFALLAPAFAYSPTIVGALAEEPVTTETITEVVEEKPTEPVEQETPVEPEIHDTQFHFSNERMEQIWRFMNEPLPLIGVSILAIGTYVVILIVKGSWGKKSVKALTQGFSDTKNDLSKKGKAIDDKIAQYEEIIEKQQKEIDGYKQTMADICKNIRNTKVQEIGKELEKEVVENETKETTNNETKEE